MNNEDKEHLRLLSIFHYVMAAMTACVAPIFTIHLGLGLLLLTGVIEPHDPDAKVGGAILFGIGGFAMALVLGMAAVVAWAGRCLAKRQGYVYCLVIAALQCLNAPLGTVLGVFTIIVLMRDSVREAFGRPAQTS
jgi:hypothetical protein